MWQRRYLRHVALAVLVASLALPAFDDWSGAMVLSVGWAGLLFLFPAWLANPLAVVAYFLAPRSAVRAGRFALAAVGLGATTFFFPGVPGDDGWSRVQHWQPGAFVWGSGLLLMLFAVRAAAAPSEAPSLPPGEPVT